MGVRITKSSILLSDDDFMTVRLWPHLREVADHPHDPSGYMPRCQRCRANQAVYGLRNGHYCCVGCLLDDDRVYRLNGAFFRIAAWAAKGS